MAYKFIKDNATLYAVKKMAGLFGLSTSAYYKWLKYGVSQRRKEKDAQLLKLIREIAVKHQRRYGSPRIHLELRNVYGRCVSKKKVASLMRENDLNSKRKRKFVLTTASKHNYEVCQNILNRDFHAQKGGQKWVSDITYLLTREGFIYLTVVLDLYDRKVIGWALSDSLETSATTIAAFEMAIKNTSAEKDLIFHSDRGVQYCSASFRQSLYANCPQARQSMSRKGNCWDNACAESFFKTLKVELETLDGKHSKALVRQSVFFYIEAYYNRIRLHSTIDYLAPYMF